MLLYVKALHIIFVVSWFAGLFYLVRLFIYHSETADMKEPEASILANQYKIMARRLLYIITYPAMVLTTIFGWWMLYLVPGYLQMGFMHVKLGLVLLLFIYQFLTHIVFRQLQQGIIRYSSNQLRIWNEVATLLLVAIVFIIVLKDNLNFIKGTVGFILVGIMLMLGIKLYKHLRQNP